MERFLRFGFHENRLKDLRGLDGRFKHLTKNPNAEYPKIKANQFA